MPIINTKLLPLGPIRAGMVLGIIIGAALGLVILVAILAYLIRYCWLRRQIRVQRELR